MKTILIIINRNEKKKLMWRSWTLIIILYMYLLTIWYDTHGHELRCTRTVARLLYCRLHITLTGQWAVCSFHCKLDIFIITIFWSDYYINFYCIVISQWINCIALNMREQRTVRITIQQQQREFHLCRVTISCYKYPNTHLFKLRPYPVASVTF